jgi:hypothetical protein
MDPELFDAMRPVIAGLERLGVRYYVGGSVASSAYGESRSTQDADLAAQLTVQHIGPLMEAWQQDYYVTESMMREAIEGRRSFNLIHTPTMMKVDIFIPQALPFDQSTLQRASQMTLASRGQELLVWIASPEDVLLHKLIWYRKGGEISDRQFDDIRGIINIQGPKLDRDYIARWAKDLGVEDLWTSAQEAK